MISVVIRHKDTGIIVIEAVAVTIRDNSIWLKTVDGEREERLAEIDWMSVVYVPSG